MGQAVWTGSIAFGLVHIPVKLYPATDPQDVRFHLFDRRTGKRVRYERTTRADETATFEPDVPGDGAASLDTTTERGLRPNRTAPQAPPEGSTFNRRQGVSIEPAPIWMRITSGRRPSLEARR